MIIPSPRGPRRARIEIIALIDIIFFLLATFVMVSLSMIRNKGVPVALPVLPEAVSQELKDFTTITLRKDGAIFLDKERVPAEALSQRLAALMKEEGANARVLIAGDEESPLGNALRLMEACRLSGLSKVTFQTRPSE